MRNLKEVAKDCIDVQNASNMMGVAYGFIEILQALRRLYPDAGTEFYNKHPIVKMYASKIHDLASMGLSDTEAFSEAYEAVKKLAGEE